MLKIGMKLSLQTYLGIVGLVGNLEGGGLNRFSKQFYQIICLDVIKKKNLFSNQGFLKILSMKDQQHIKPIDSHISIPISRSTYKTES